MENCPLELGLGRNLVELAHLKILHQFIPTLSAIVPSSVIHIHIPDSVYS